MCLLYVFQCLLYNRESLEPEEVHLDKSGRLNHTAFILGNEQFIAVLVVGSAHRHPVGDIVAPDDNAASVNTGVADIPFKGLGIVHCAAHIRVGTVVFLLHLWEELHAVGNSDFCRLAVWQCRHIVGF